MEEIFELVCQECSKIFESTDVNAEICLDCWENLVGEKVDMRTTCIRYIEEKEEDE